MTGHHVDLVAFHVPRQDRFGLAGDDPFPELFSHPLYIVRIQAHSWAICALDRFNPMKYRHKIQTPSG